MTINIRKPAVVIVATGILGVVVGSVGSLLLLSAISRHHDSHRDAGLRPDEDRIQHGVKVTHHENNDASRFGNEQEASQRNSSEAMSTADDISRGRSTEMLKKTSEDRKRNLIAIHESHPLDPVWSAAATNAFKADFVRMQKKVPVTLVSVDCRARSCLAIAGWPNYTAARINGALLATFDYSVSCATHVVQPPPADISLPYQSTVQFDCSNHSGNKG